MATTPESDRLREHNRELEDGIWLCLHKTRIGKIFHISDDSITISRPDTIRELEKLINNHTATEVRKAEDKLYEGGEKKFIKMLLDHGMLIGEVNADYLYDTQTIRIPKKTIRKYFDGEIDPTNNNEGDKS